MLALSVLVALPVFFAQVDAQAGWRSGGTLNVVLGVSYGETPSEVYGAVYSKNNGGGKVYYSGDRSNFQIGTYINGGALNMDIAISNDGQTVAVTGPGGVFTGGPGQSFDPVAVESLSDVVF
jgi:hypothetical protein